MCILRKCIQRKKLKCWGRKKNVLGLRVVSVRFLNILAPEKFCGGSVSILLTITQFFDKYKLVVDFAFRQIEVERIQSVQWSQFLPFS